MPGAVKLFQVSSSHSCHWNVWYPVTWRASIMCALGFFIHLFFWEGIRVYPEPFVLVWFFVLKQSCALSKNWRIVKSFSTVPVGSPLPKCPSALEISFTLGYFFFYIFFLFVIPLKGKLIVWKKTWTIFVVSVCDLFRGQDNLTGFTNIMQK